MPKQTKLDTKEKTRKASSTDREIVIDISADGEVEVEVFNAADTCHDLTEGLEKAIGSVDDVEDKGDFYKKQPITKKPRIKTTR